MGEKFSNEVLYSALSLARQEDFRHDIIECETKTRRFVSMFGVAWGIIPEVDLDSEIFRFIGSSRGWLMAAWKWLWPKFQPGVIHYLPHDPDTDNEDITLPDINDPVPDNWVTEQVAKESSVFPFLESQDFRDLSTMCTPASSPGSTTACSFVQTRSLTMVGCGW